MSDLLIFILGIIVTAVTLTALILIGSSEARALEALEREGRDPSPPDTR